MKNTARFFLFAALTLGLGACSTVDPVETPVTETPDTVQEADTKEVLEFEEQMEDMISLEGMEEPITLNLYNPQDALFLTYVPEDLLAEEMSGGEGEAYYFYANYGGEKLEDIYLQLMIFSEHVTEQPSAEDEDSTYAVAVENMERVEENAYYDWAIEEYISPEGSRMVALGEHQSQYFMVVVNSSVEYSEGFVPRANKVLEHLYWKDTNEYLVKE